MFPFGIFRFESWSVLVETRLKLEQSKTTTTKKKQKHEDEVKWLQFGLSLIILHFFPILL